MSTEAIRSRGGTCMVCAIWMRSEIRRVVVALLDVNSVIVALIRQTAVALIPSTAAASYITPSTTALQKLQTTFDCEGPTDIRWRIPVATCILDHHGGGDVVHPHADDRSRGTDAQEE
ncbi:hypothetical protein SLEP1_g29088 [Rubroshorea leprosula]|uniref:Uncharacterized protein n=1 Tax=Rubroshorea leprosula TaxID=152421 RepID=A0AAV5K501_9ROSI|nr:hypothetical protein SLEP1_g29088 [Rubroshorea leprosula]